MLLLIELVLNAMPYEPYLLGWMGLYSSAFALWAFSYYKATNRWMYPVSLLPLGSTQLTSAHCPSKPASEAEQVHAAQHGLQHRTVETSRLPALRAWAVPGSCHLALASSTSCSLLSMTLRMLRSS